jgi:diguanylate cyclase (GGDEF)-like protein
VAWIGFRQSQRHRDLPPETYISLVTSLFSDPRTLAVGALGTLGAALITAWKADSVLLLYCALVMAAVTCARAVDMHLFRRCREDLQSISVARYWELRYAFGASVYVALMGVWCLVAFTTTSDPFVHLLSFSMILVNMIGVAGRNFGSRPLVNAQLICAGVPMTAALFSMGDMYYAVFGCVLIPFFTSQKFIADRLRRTFVDAVIAARDVSVLANRFDTALNNMPHGLGMFDSEKRLVVYNSRLAALMGVCPNRIQRGLSAQELLSLAAVEGVLVTSDLQSFISRFESNLTMGEHAPLAVQTASGRALCLTFQAMENGGSVVLMEDVTERRNAEAEIHRLARYDPLTGLPNRSSFNEQMRSALAAIPKGKNCAVLFIDLDHFKQVNDTMGHPAGDELLCAAAKRLRALVRQSDVVARFGGDEFVVLQAAIAGPQQPTKLATRIVEALAEPYEIYGHQVVIGASIGIAMAPRDGSDTDVLMKNADTALYRVKAEGRKAWRFFAQGMDVAAQARRDLELDLRNAVLDNAFEVHYQPILNLKTGRVAGCEALLRWPHPVRGMIPPGEFISIAEEMGLITQMGDWVLHEACTQCATWPTQVSVAVNLSSIHFSRGDVVQSVKEALTASGLAAKRLEIEITESVFLQNSARIRELLQELRRLGVRISLDDFGTGYSSLSYLHSFPLNKVKIDRSFLQATSKRALTLLTNVARLSAELGMSVTVEGVETREQLAFVARDENIDEAQGYLFSAAVSAAEIRLLLDPGLIGTLVPQGFSRQVA